MNYVLGVCLAATVYLMIQFSMDHKYNQGFAAGQKAALTINPVSEELEMICAGLWVGKQNEKARQK